MKSGKAITGNSKLETKILDETRAFELTADFFAVQNLRRKKVLAIIPDNTRTAPIDMMFRMVCRLLLPKVKQLDFMIALGTHPPLNDAAVYRRVGIHREEYQRQYSKVRFFNHHWNISGQLREIGKICRSDVEEISRGMMSQEVRVTINKTIFDYDVLLIIGPVFPHEVVGFSGGNKYLFPGISGPEIIDMFHWLGALITSPRIMGRKQTPVRRIIDQAAQLVPVPRLCISLVVRGKNLYGLFAGEPENAWEAATALSKRLHIIYKNHPYQSVLSVAPSMYEDLWTGGKCAYKLEPVVADGGELIIYAPHIKEISVTHGKVIESIGYHTRDYFVKQMERFKNIPGGILAHSTHVKGVGEFKDGIEEPRINVVLATGISREKCRQVNLGYRNPDTIHLKEWQNREDAGRLFVPRAGEILYRLRDDPFV